MKKRRLIKKSLGSKITNILIYTIIFIASFICVVPFLFTISASISSPSDILTRKFFIIPHSFDLTTYKYLFSSNTLIRSMGVSALLTIVGTIISMSLSILTAYPLSKAHLKGRGIIQAMIVFTMLFSGGMIPTYLLVSSLHLTNTLWSLWLPNAISAYNMILLRNFFSQLPSELEEAAKIDGCGYLKTLIRIVIPLSLPAIATFSLFYAVGYWNSFFDAMLYLDNDKLWPIQVWLRQIVIMSSGGFSDNASLSDISVMPTQNVSYAVIVFATLPILVVYPFIQKFFTKGLMVGSVKG